MSQLHLPLELVLCIGQYLDLSDTVAVATALQSHYGKICFFRNRNYIKRLVRQYVLSDDVQEIQRLADLADRFDWTYLTPQLVKTALENEKWMTATILCRHFGKVIIPSHYMLIKIDGFYYDIEPPAWFSFEFIDWDRLRSMSLKDRIDYVHYPCGFPR